jgi:hypothetical protein
MAAFTAALVAAATAAKASLAGLGRWQLGTRRLRARLEAAREPLDEPRVRFTALERIPRPAARWLREALTDGQACIEAVTITHRGEFNTAKDGERWRSFRSQQRVLISRPGFDWDARIALVPGVPVRVHDAYIAGTGLLRAAVGGLVNVVKVEDQAELAHDELMRWLAEAAWYPSALLPGARITWTAIDGETAAVSVCDGPLQASLNVGFDADGLIARVCSDARGRMVDGESIPTAWEGRFWNHQRIQGMCIPLDGEVAWLLPEGRQPYWRGRIEAIAYEFAAVD